MSWCDECSASKKNEDYNLCSTCTNKLQVQLAEKYKTIEKLRECLEHGYRYLKATYDIHTWKDEPEYAMMKSFEQCLEEIDSPSSGKYRD